MANRVYDLKIAESHLSLIAEALGAMPYNRVYQLLSSINIQVQRQLQQEQIAEDKAQMAPMAPVTDAADPGSANGFAEAR